jgi:hypothetical protein
MSTLTPSLRNLPVFHCQVRLRAAAEYIESSFEPHLDWLEVL